MSLFQKKLAPEARSAALQYYQAALEVTAFQEREGDRYNSALMAHMNSLDKPASAAAMGLASKRLSESARELKRRHATIESLPDIDLVAADYAAWGLLYHKYAAWADAQHDAFMAIVAGRTPVASRVSQLMADSEASRVLAEKATQRLLAAIGLKAPDVQRIMLVAQQSIEASEWEPPSENQSGDEVIGRAAQLTTDLLLQDDQGEAEARDAAAKLKLAPPDFLASAIASAWERLARDRDEINARTRELGWNDDLLAGGRTWNDIAPRFSKEAQTELRELADNMRELQRVVHRLAMIERILAGQPPN